MQANYVFGKHSKFIKNVKNNYIVKRGEKELVVFILFVFIISISSSIAFYLFYILIMDEIGFMWKMTFEISIKSLRFETPWVRKNGFYESVCLSVCLSVVGRVRISSLTSHIQSKLRDWALLLCFWK